MLAVFPDLLFLSPLGVTLVRIVVGAAFVYVAWTYMRRSKQARYVNRGLGPFTHTVAALLVFLGAEPAHVDSVGTGGRVRRSLLSYIMMGTALTLALLGAFLIIGLFTQAAALIGLVFATSWSSHRGSWPVARSTSTILAILCCALLLMGSGAFAFDLPL